MTEYIMTIKAGQEFINILINKGNGIVIPSAVWGVTEDGYFPEKFDGKYCILELGSYHLEILNKHDIEYKRFVSKKRQPCPTCGRSLL